MGYEVKWHTPDSIVLVRLWGDLDIQIFPDLDRDILQLMEQSERILVHIWVDLREVTEFPSKVWQVQKALTHLNHPRVGWSVIITQNRLIQFVGSVITQLAKARFRAFSTPEEAMSFLRTMDPNLEAKAV